MLTQVLVNSAVSSDETLVSKRGAQQWPVTERCFLTRRMPSLEEVVQCAPARGEHLAEVRCLVPSAG